MVFQKLSSVDWRGHVGRQLESFGGLQVRGRLVSFLRRLTMSKWTRIKSAVFAATAVVAALQLGGCLNLDAFGGYKHLVELVVIGNILD
jgi:hypothetical protein